MSYLAALFRADDLEGPGADGSTRNNNDPSSSSSFKQNAAAAGRNDSKSTNRGDKAGGAGSSPDGKKYIEFDMNVVRDEYEAEPLSELDDMEFIRRWTLHRAARRGNIEALNRLLGMFRTFPRWAGTTDEDGFTALHRAAEAADDAAGAASIARLAGVEGVDPEAASADLQSWRPLHRAVISNNRKCVKALLAEAKASPDCVDAAKKTPLHWCAQYGRIECARELVKAGANLSAQDNFKRTPLHTAAQFSQLEMIELLCQQRAEKEANDFELMTPLLIAAAHGKADAVCVLSELGADVEARDHGFGTALLIACEKAAFLQDKPAEEMRYVETVKALVTSCNANVEAETRDARLRPIHLAARRGSVRLLQFLLDAQAYADARTGDTGRSALHLVCACSFGKSAKALSQYEECARALVASGRVDCWAVDNDMLTPAAIAETRKAYEVGNCIPKEVDEVALLEEEAAAEEQQQQPFR